MLNYNFIRTYGRRRGRKKKGEINKYEKKYLFNYKISKKNIIIDIGSGNGENSIKLSNEYPNNLIIACDVYIDGNISLIKKIEKKNINNIKICDENCFILLNKIPNYCVNEIWILYPDPWPKKKHNKRRLINKFFLNTLLKVLKKKGKVYIATDNQNYFISIMSVFYKNKAFKWKNNIPFLWLKPFKNMAKTAYFKKSQINGENSYYLIFKKI